MSERTQPPLDPGLVAAGEKLKAQGLVFTPPHLASLADARRTYDAVGAFLCGLSAPLADETTFSVAGPHGPVACRLFRPPSSTPLPVLVYLHGGGFSLGRAAEWAGFARDMARHARVAILLVDYARAPEHRFPAALEETQAVLRYLRYHAATYRLDPERVAVGGDSAGANLALAAAVADGIEHPGGLRMVLLYYGVYSMDRGTPGWQQLDGYGLSVEFMSWIWDNYRSGGGAATDWRVEPLHADHRGLPFVYSLVGTHDPLIDDAHALKKQLDASGVPNRLVVADGLNHGFVRLGPIVPKVRELVRQSAEVLGSVMSGDLPEGLSAPVGRGGDGCPGDCAMCRCLDGNQAR